MEYWLRRLNQEIQKHDENLRAKRHGERIDIFRESTRYVPYCVFGKTIWVSVPIFYDVFSLTHNFKKTGVPVNWGIEPVCQRLKMIDTWNHPDFMDRLIKDYEKMKESEKRSRMNDFESFAHDFRPEFKRAFNEYNVASMEKVHSEAKYERKKKKWVS